MNKKIGYIVVVSMVLLTTDLIYHQVNGQEDNQTTNEFLDYLVCLHDFNKGFCDSLYPNGEYLQCINNDRIKNKFICDLYKMDVE